jgi:hypothetical protein
LLCRYVHNDVCYPHPTRLLSDERPSSASIAKAADILRTPTAFDQNFST